MSTITKENIIDRPSLKLIQILTHLQNKAFASEQMEMTHLGSATVHHLIACLLLESLEKDLVRHIAHGINHLNPEPPRSPTLMEHRPSHLTQGSVFPFHHAILGRHIRTQKLIFKTQVMAKGFEVRVFKF
jgi:hypothetical protein